MARHDDDNDENDEAVAEKPLSRRGESPEDEESDDERPSKRQAREEESHSSPQLKAMPWQMLAAIILSVGWGFLSLYGSCSGAALPLAAWWEVRSAHKHFGGGAVPDMLIPPGQRTGFLFTVAGTYVVLFLLSAVLLAGGILLLIRKKHSQYIAMAAPVLMLIVMVLGFLVSLIFTGGSIVGMSHSGMPVVGLLTKMFFSFVVGGCNIFFLLNKKVKEALE